MRIIHVAIFAILGTFWAQPAGAQDAPASASDLTVLLNFKGPWSRTVVKEMEREVASILKPSGLRPSWEFEGKHPQGDYTQVAVMVFRGACEFDPLARRTQDAGPYAFTWITDHQVLPFGEVNCDRVAGAVQNALAGRGFTAADQLVGRALGRVVAHELVHIVTRSVQHSTEGVEKPALNGRQLIQPDLPLTAEDAVHLREKLAGQPD